MTDPRPSSLESLIQDHAPFLERLARALVGDPDRARDLVQETWAVALATPGALASLGDQGDGATRGWLATVLRRRSFSGMRKAGIRKTDPISVEQASGDQLPDATATRWERQRIVQEALHGLPEPYRTTLILRFQDDLSPTEIAERLGNAASTVRTQVARGLEQLREVLDRQHPGGRVEWLSALLPLGWPGVALPVPTAGSGITLAASTQSVSTTAAAIVMKKSLLGVFAVLLAALAIYQPWTASGASHSDSSAEVAASEGPVDLEAPGGEEASQPAIVGVSNVAETDRQSIESRESTSEEDEGALSSTEIAADPVKAVGTGSFILSGRALLMDGTPIPGQRVSAKSEAAGAEDFGRSTTDDTGAFEIAMMSEGPHTLTLRGHGDIDGAELQGVLAPSEIVEFRVDAVVFRAHLPKDIDLSLFEGAGHSVLAYGVEDLPFEMFHYGGFRPESAEEISQELLPTGPGYLCLVGTGTGDSGRFIALLPPGAASGVYDIDFVTESPELASLQVALTGVAIVAPSYVTVGLRWMDRGESRSYPSSLYIREGQPSGRTGALIPGEYSIETSVFSPPPNAWIVPKALTQTMTLKAGDQEIIEVELVEGGGLELMVSSDDEIDPRGFLLEVRTAGSSGWKKHSTYIPTEDGQFQVGRIDVADTHYKSWKPLPVGETRVRLSAKGFRTVEETLYIKAAALTKWNPRMERLP